MTTTLIAGANRGLGLETARRLIGAGHTVHAGVRDPDRADEARALGAHVVRLDVADTASVEAALARLPELDVLVTTPGSSAPPSRSTTWTPRRWRRCWTST